MPIVPIAAALLLAATSPDKFQAQLDARAAAFDAAIATVQRQAQETSDADAAKLTLPVNDHPSAVQYCAYMLTHIAAPDLTIWKATRSKAKWRDASKAEYPPDLDESIGWGAVDYRNDHPFFDKVASGSVGANVHLATADGVCTIMTIGEPGAAERTETWLHAKSSPWTEVRGGRSKLWRAFRFTGSKGPALPVVIYHAKLSDAARKAGVSAADVVEVAGLP